MFQRNTLKSGLWPLAVIWLAVHAALLAVILGAKFLFTKTVLMTMLAAGVLAFLFTQIRAKPRKLFHSP
jgi:predicted PurR-regulated permease PerM